MNKKFSTLLAGLLLAGSFTTNAGVVLKKDGGNGLYQLAVNVGGTPKGVLVMDADGKLSVAATPTALQNSLWCVDVIQQDLGVNPTYEFLNKATGKSLDLTMDEFGLAGQKASTASAKYGIDQIIVGGEIGNWAFSNTYAAGTGTQDDQLIYSFFKADSVVALNIDANNKIVAEKYAAKTLTADQAGNAVFSLVAPTIDALKAAEINTKIGSQLADAGVTLKFNPDYKGVDVKNPFSTESFITEASGTTDYVYVYKKGATADKKEYLMVDTSYVNENGVKFLAFKWITNPALATDAYKDQYKFRFQYDLEKDSVTINVLQARFKETEASWAAVTPFNHVDDATLAGTPATSKELFVKLQDLVRGTTRIVTIGERAINTKISFEIPTCKPEVDKRTSLANDLYVIKNTAGKYLAIPLYGDSLPQWVTLDNNMTAWNMPAFQWAVEKIRTSDKLKATSPVKITNREFGTVVISDLQLLTDATSALEGATVNVAGFENDKNNVKANPYVGYRFLDKDSMTVTTYNLRYLHEFTSEKYMGASSIAGDSILYVGAKSSFQLKGMSDAGVEYGYTTANIEGMKKLARKAYTLNLKSTGKFIVADVENRYAVSAAKTKAVFYLKENNDKAGIHYFALIDTMSYNNMAPDSLRKVGVDDNNLYLKAQNMMETRTSAFSVEIDVRPLYRRFNNEALGESEKTLNAADSLSFYDNVRGEYLMDENNKEGGLTDKKVDYLGIWTADKATGLGFRIDTAWVTRGLGYIKPQYLISVDRNDQEGTPGKDCTEASGTHRDADGNLTDAANCAHATKGRPGFEYGKYLVSFADSVTMVGRDKPYADVKDGYTRVGFVKAIHTGDSLYILVNGYENIEPAKLNVADIIKAYIKAGINKTYIVDLVGDKHKNCTWSFRYVNPDKSVGVTEEGPANAFLIESNTHQPEISIAPERAAWIKMQNGCVVLTDDKSTFESAKTGGDGALVFNTVQSEGKLATDTDNNINASQVVVTSTEAGKITIANAENKSVVISNILGQAIANTVITSNNATISVPAGIVVVAVEGETAVKAIVK